MVNLPLIHCPYLNLPDAADWSTIAVAFNGRPSLPLRQAWLAAPEPDFSPGKVWLGWRDDVLLVYAVLEDRDIYNDEREFNVPSFLRGDVFEIFLRPVGQEAYYEFHISPHNQKLQVRWPSAAAVCAFRQDPGENLAGLEQYKVWQPEIQARTSIERSRWRVFAEIPMPLVGASGRGRAAVRWKVSFSRYDYSRNRTEPVLSSTSPHTKCDFHRQDEWGELTFGNQPMPTASVGRIAGTVSPDQ